jgi:2-succinyl-6-hydroxy-2,4-cyclohexadiene-1-carboxylate synthase
MLAYSTRGSPSRPAFCFLHGFMGASGDWENIVDGLAPHAYCLTVDLPGHGASTDAPSWDYSMEGATQALADVLDDAGIQQCTLVGYSMGGRIALYFARYQTERVRRLVLESASPGLAAAEERAARRAVDADRAAAIRDDLRGFLEDWYRMPLFASLQKHDLVETMVERRARNDPKALARVLDGLGTGTQPSLWDDLPDLDVPTLLLTGALDDKYVDLTAEMAFRNPSMHRVVVPNAGHNVHAERPQAFVSHLVHFAVHC